MAIQAMDDVRREELRAEPAQVAAALQAADPETRRNLLWGMRKNPVGWTAAQTDAMYWLQRSALKSARAWRLRMALREVYARARQHNSAEQAASDLKAWTSWARRCRLEPFKKLATTIKERFDAVVRGMLDGRHRPAVHREADDDVEPQRQKHIENRKIDDAHPSLPAKRCDERQAKQGNGDKQIAERFAHRKPTDPRTHARSPVFSPKRPDGRNISTKISTTKAKMSW